MSNRDIRLATHRLRRDSPEVVVAEVLTVEVESCYVVVRGRCGKAYRCPAKDAAALAQKIAAAAKEAEAAREVIFPRLAEAEGEA